MKIPDIFNQSWGRLIFGSGCHVWYAMRVCLCFNPDLNDSLFDELIKRPNIHQSLISGNQRLTCPPCQYLLWPVWGWDTSWVLADTRQRCAGADNCQSPERLSRCQLGQLGASQRHTCHVTHHVSRSSESWRVTVVKCDSNSLKLSSISLSGCDKRNSPIKLFLTSAESQHQTLRSSSNAWAWHW